jgi:hypothetical protein
MQRGILTVDAALIIRTWDGWLAACTGIAAERRGTRAGRRRPAVRERALLPRFEQVLATGEIQVLAPALHRYLVPCPPAAASPHFDRMQQRVTLGPLRDGDHVVGVMVTIEDVTARLDGERTLAANCAATIRSARGRGAAGRAVGALEQPQAFTTRCGPTTGGSPRRGGRAVASRTPRHARGAAHGASRRAPRLQRAEQRAAAAGHVRRGGHRAAGRPAARRRRRPAHQAALALGEQRHPPPRRR